MLHRGFALGAFLGAAGVITGAFGAHALKARLSAEMLAVWETGARYHLIHALALIAAAEAAARWPGVWASSALGLFVAGILIFSGSLYALALTGVRAFGAITPLGGLCLIGGWLCLGVAAMRGQLPKL